MIPLEPKPREGFSSVVFAKDQPQYLPLPALTDGSVVETRWGLTWRERFRVFIAGHVHLQIVTFGQPLQPIRLTVDRAWDES